MMWHEKVSLDPCICSPQNAIHIGFDLPSGYLPTGLAYEKNGPPQPQGRTIST